MVARIKIKDALLSNFYYNENKEKQGVASCLMAENYPADAEHLSPVQRLKSLQKAAAMNEKIKVNSVHISLNFDPSENLSPDTLKDIVKTYMDRIGFGQQPYLVYQHFDAGHPHIHILSVKVRMDGSGIDTHNIGLKKSEPARKEIEREYRLIRAEDQQKKSHRIQPVHPQKVVYGKSESRRAIANVLEHVLPVYKYTSLPELNAVLNLYNVSADRGSVDSRTFKNNGLYYRILDETGRPVGVPIKASAFPNKPTLKFLEKQFLKNGTERDKHKVRLKNAIDLFILKTQYPSLKRLTDALQHQGIHTIVRQSSDGFIYGLTYVDHRTKCVFNGSALGKPYSAKGVQERCEHQSNMILREKELNAFEKTDIGVSPTDGKRIPSGQEAATEQPVFKLNEKSLSSILLQSEQVYEPIPYQLKKTRKKKKKRKGLSNNN